MKEMMKAANCDNDSILNIKNISKDYSLHVHTYKTELALLTDNVDFFNSHPNMKSKCIYTYMGDIALDGNFSKKLSLFCIYIYLKVISTLSLEPNAHSDVTL